MYITYLYRKEVSCRNLHTLFNLKIIMSIFTKLRSVTTPWVKIKLRNVFIVISNYFGYPNYHNECVLLTFQLRCSRLDLYFMIWNRFINFANIYLSTKYYEEVREILKWNLYLEWYFHTPYPHPTIMFT